MLTIYVPFNNLQSKAWEVFKGVMKSWPEPYQTLDNIKATDPLANAMFWGFVNNNLNLIKRLESRKHNFWFTDTPYFGRFDNNNLKYPFFIIQPKNNPGGKCLRLNKKTAGMLHLTIEPCSNTPAERFEAYPYRAYNEKCSSN